MVYLVNFIYILLYLYAHIKNSFISGLYNSYTWFLDSQIIKDVFPKCGNQVVPVNHGRENLHFYVFLLSFIMINTSCNEIYLNSAFLEWPVKCIHIPSLVNEKRKRREVL